eukprot:Skav228702  [mRNA]  locus=scaffold3376:12771:14129:+ [translate_table: standard]
MAPTHSKFPTPSDWSKAEDYLLPQQRTRVFLRGLRKTVGKGEVPEPLGPFGKRNLVDFLDHGLPPVDRSSLTTVMQKNLVDGVAKLKEMLASGDLRPTDLVVFPLDRAEGKVYKRRFSENIVPTLTTTNKYLFVVSLDFDLAEKDQKFFRFLSPTERMLLQGFSHQTLAGCSEALRIKGAGNAYPVPLMIAALAPLLKEVRAGLGALPPTHKSLMMKDAQDVRENFDKFMEECRVASSSQKNGARKKRRSAAAKPKAEAKGKAKAAKKKRGGKKEKKSAKADGKTKKKTIRKRPAGQPKRKTEKKKKLSVGHRSQNRFRWIESSSS